MAILAIKNVKAINNYFSNVTLTKAVHWELLTQSCLLRTIYKSLFIICCQFQSPQLGIIYCQWSISEFSIQKFSFENFWLGHWSRIIAFEGIMGIKIITNLTNPSLNHTELLTISLLLNTNIFKVKTLDDLVGKMGDMTWGLV